MLLRETFIYLHAMLSIEENMTRKHFKALAQILHDHKAYGVLIRDMADFCYNHNSNFDRARFYDACGLEL